MKLIIKILIVAGIFTILSAVSASDCELITLSETATRVLQGVLYFVSAYIVSFIRAVLYKIS